MNDSLINAVKKLHKQCPLVECYKWDVPAGVSRYLAIPDHEVGAYAQNVYLKENLCHQLSSDETLDCHYWIIQEWGGIKNFKRNKSNDEKIGAFKEQLDTGMLTSPVFNSISSLSKLAAFMNPETCSIYDSRAVYALNWLLFLHTEDRKLFPRPAGRNAELAKYDLETLVRLSGYPLSFRSKRTAYHEYCELMVELSKKALGKNRPYYMEMLLFTAAPTRIIQDIIKRSKVEIHTNEGKDK